MSDLLVGLAAAALGALVAAAVLRRREQGPPDAMREQLLDMQSQLARAVGLVQEFERGRAEQLGMLSAEIRHVHRQGVELADATRTLREALVSTKARGQWGERMAEDVLRLAGLIENVNYRKQKATRSGSVPDFTFLLGADRCLHMDVKFPINAYLRHAESGDARHSAEFLRDVRARVRELAARDYIDPEVTVDFVLMFVPNDQLLTFIHEQDPQLLDDALRQKVVCCSPLSLFPVLQVVRHAAEGLRLERHVAETLALLGAFSAQWGRFAQELDGLGSHLERAQRAYDTLASTRRRTLERALGDLTGVRLPASAVDEQHRRALDVAGRERG